MSQITKSQQRLLELFSDIEDETIKEIMSEVVMLESRHRSGNFPLRDVRNIVDREANLIERHQEGGDYAN
jgi:hypothetical protein